MCAERDLVPERRYDARRVGRCIKHILVPASWARTSALRRVGGHVNRAKEQRAKGRARSNKVDRKAKGGLSISRVSRFLAVAQPTYPIPYQTGDNVCIPVHVKL